MFWQFESAFLWACASYRVLAVLIWPLLPTHCRFSGVCWAWSHSVTHTHTHTLGSTPLDEGSVHCRSVTDSTPHSLGTDVHTPGGIQTRNSSKLATADPRLRQHDRRDRTIRLQNINCSRLRSSQCSSVRMEFRHMTWCSSQLALKSVTWWL